MNITIKITHTNGTVMDISIPVAIEQPAQTAPVDTSAVVIAKDDDTASEPAILADDEPPYMVEPDDILPSGKRFKSVSDMVADLAVELRAEEAAEISRENILGKERVGEDGEGDGRIGGMGERKEEAGEGEGGEENLEQFKCSDGFYVMPPNLYSDFCAAFGQPTVDRELIKARLWMDCNPSKRKTRRGMSRYLNAWLCRAQGEKRQPLKGRSGSLLEANNTSQQGW